MNEMNSQTSLNSKSNKKVWGVIIILIIVIAVFCIFMITNSSKENDDQNTNKNQEVKNENQNSDDNKQTENEISNEDREDVIYNIESEENYDENGNFLMYIEDVFTITGRGTVVTGQIQRGTVNIGDTIQIIGFDDEITTTVENIEQYRKDISSSKAGENVGILLKDVERTDVERGQVLAAPGTMLNGKTFDAKIYVFTQDEGGRGEAVTNNSTGLFYITVSDISGKITLLNDVESVSPGETADIKVTLDESAALEEGSIFVIRSGGRTIAKGRVTKIYE